MLVRVAVDGVGEQVGPDAAVVEQRVALARRAVADDRLPGAAALEQELEQVVADRATVRGEPGVTLDGVQPGRLLGGEHVARPRSDGSPRDLGGRAHSASEPPWRRQLLDVDDAQVGGGERPLRRQQREVLVVLVVDRVVLAALDEPQQVRDLDATASRRRPAARAGPR